MVRKGLPVAVRQNHDNGGLKRNFFELDAVRLWAAGNLERTSRLQEAAARMGKADGAPVTTAAPEHAGPVESPGPETRVQAGQVGPAGPATWDLTAGDRPKPELAGHQPARSGWDDALDRARKAERSAFGNWVRCLTPTKDYPNGDQASGLAANKVWLATMGELRRMEVEATKIERSRGESVSRADHERVCADSHAIVAQRLKSLAKKLAPMVLGKTDNVEVHAILSKEILACMRDLERMLNEL
jgi:hypothetical protein